MVEETGIHRGIFGLRSLPNRGSLRIGDSDSSGQVAFISRQRILDFERKKFISVDNISIYAIMATNFQVAMLARTSHLRKMRKRRKILLRTENLFFEYYADPPITG